MQLGDAGAAGTPHGGGYIKPKTSATSATSINIMYFIEGCLVADAFLASGQSVTSTTAPPPRPSLGGTGALTAGEGFALRRGMVRKSPAGIEGMRSCRRPTARAGVVLVRGLLGRT
jgi:hypothetical protein